MALLRFFLRLSLFWAPLSLCAQQLTRYKSYDGHLYTRQQVDSMVAQTNERGKAQGMGAYWKVREKEQRADTPVYSYDVTRCSQAVVAAHHKLMNFVGKPLPAFELRDLSGHLVRSSALLGKPAVLNMWFTTCGGCIDEMPALSHVMAEPANKGIQFLALTYEKPAAVKSFLQKHPFSFRHLPDAQAYCDLFTQAYPLTIFVDKQGVIRDIQGPLPFVGQARTNAKQVPTANDSGYLDATTLYSALSEIR